MFLKNINFKQPKYMIPAIIYLPVLVTAYFIFDMFDTEIQEKPTGLETTEYLNAKLPQANIKGDGVGNRYDNMRRSFGKIQDFSAIDNIDRNDEIQFEDYESHYSENELEQMAQDAEQRSAELDRLREMQEAIANGAEKGAGMIGDEELSLGSEEDRLARSQARQDSAMAELNRALADARSRSRKAVTGAHDSIAAAAIRAVTEEKTIQSDAVHSIDDNAEASEVVKLNAGKSDYFNTIVENEPAPNLIKAIIDEDITAVNGSRVRLRLLDDVRINEVVLKKGAYIYATMSGFGSQRVKGSVTSILVDDDLVKVNLSLYDTDGLEGLYVPSSRFRETAKNVGSSAMNGSMSLSQGSSGRDMIRTWGMNALNNAYQKSTNAVSQSIKQNKAKLKYGSHVYLVNGREKRNQ